MTTPPPVENQPQRLRLAVMASIVIVLAWLLIANAIRPTEMGVASQLTASRTRHPLPGPSPVLFVLDKPYVFESVRVTRLPQSPEEKPVLVWLLERTTHGEATDRFMYGSNIEGMNATLRRTRLEADVPYRIELRAAGARGDLEFQTRSGF